MLLLRLLNPHISLPFSNLSMVKERIGYKLLSLTYKVLTTSQPSYLNNLISVQPPRSTRSSLVVTLSRPPAISTLKFTDRSFRIGSPRLWNQLPDSFRQLRQSCLDSPPLIHLSAHHWLRGSASTVLTATGQVNGRWRILTPHRIETHEPTATKFRTID